MFNIINREYLLIVQLCFADHSRLLIRIRQKCHRIPGIEINYKTAVKQPLDRG